MEKAIQKASLIQYSGDKEFTLNISDGLEAKIRAFCALSPRREWSGVLFYKFEGDYNKGMTIHANDMYLMDQGSAAHTEFDLNEPEITRYMVMEGLVDHCIGLIHSHNTMKAFFSGEDASTLLEHGSAMNNFVSLVVNNDGEYVARLTRQLNLNGSCTKITKGTITSPVFNTDEVASFPVEKNETHEVKDRWVECVDLTINKPDVTTYDFIERFGEVASKCSVKAPSTNMPFFQSTRPYENHYENPFGMVQGKLFNETEEDGYNEIITKEIKSAVDSVNWKFLNYEDWFNQLINGNPFSSVALPLTTINRLYKSRFTTEIDFESWFEVWLDFMVATFDWVPSTTRKSLSMYSSEELLLYKVFMDIRGTDYVYRDSMLDTIITRVV